MARTTLLDTRTVNFQELIGNGRIYHVPPYCAAAVSCSPRRPHLAGRLRVAG